jgi:Tol biopolymer transport system component
VHGRRIQVSSGGGDQSDPHVSGDWIAYTSETDGGSEVRYQNLLSGVSYAVPNNGAMDFVSDLHGSTILFTRLSEAGSSVFSFDLAKGGDPVEIAPQGGVSRREPILGGSTIIWQDFDLKPSISSPELVAYDLSSHALTRLTSDDSLDKDPSVSPDGTLVVWTKCNTEGLDCAIWRSQQSHGSWTSGAVTDAVEASSPDTNGTWIVYGEHRPGGATKERIIAWLPAHGGVPERLDLPGDSRNPVVSHHLLGFEHRSLDGPSSNWDIYLYDLGRRTLYRLTDSPEDKVLSDLTVSPDGNVRVAWTSEGDDYNYKVETLGLSLGPIQCSAGAALSTCAQPGSRPVLDTWEGKAGSASSRSFSSAPGQGLLCLEMAAKVSGAEVKVELNGVEVTPSSSANRSWGKLEAPVMLRSKNSIHAKGAYRARMLGPEPGCLGDGTHAATPKGKGEAVVLRGRFASILDGTDHVPFELPGAPHASHGCSQGGAPGLLGFLVLLVSLGLLPRAR